MTAGKLAYEYNKSASNKFIFGASIVAAFYCFIATQFSFYIQSHPDFVKALYKVGALIFGILTAYYFYKAFQVTKLNEEPNPNRNNFILTGIFISFLNILPIPFYTGIALVLAQYEIFSFYKSEIALLIISVGLGTYSVIKLYAKFYYKISIKKARKESKQQSKWNANHLIATITFAIMLLALYRINY